MRCCASMGPNMDTPRHAVSVDPRTLDPGSWLRKDRNPRACEREKVLADDGNPRIRANTIGPRERMP